jgi:transposase
VLLERGLLPSSIVVELSAGEQAHLREHMRRLRLVCPLLRLHILLLLARRRSPTEIADWLLCSRSSVYAVAAAWQRGWRPGRNETSDERVFSLGLAPSLRRSLLALLAKAPMAEGWCRTRWSCATLALSLQARRGLQVSTETMRRWLHGLGWRWKRTKLTAKDNDPQRAPQTGPYPPGGRSFTASAGAAVCRRTGHCSTAQEWISMDAAGHANRSADAR